MAMDYNTRKRAIVRIGEELQRRGWKLYGYSEDQSDSMTDYYHPANWYGIATHDKAAGIVVGVGVNDWMAHKYSGQNEMDCGWEVDQQVTCDKCNGTGIWPDGATLAQARENPLGQHAIEFARENNQTLLMPSAVSPLHYHSDGSPKCLYCHGKGYTEKGHSTNYVKWTWPKFQQTPRGRAWHIEKSGKILASGTGLGKAASYDDKVWKAAVKKIANAIEAAALGNKKPESPKAENKSPESGNGTKSGKVEIRYEGSWTWIKFPSRPPLPVRTAIKDIGARWGRKREAWYIREVVESHVILGVISNAV